MQTILLTYSRFCLVRRHSYALIQHKQLDHGKKTSRSYTQEMYLQAPTTCLIYISLILATTPNLVLGQTWTGMYRWAGQCDTISCCCGAGAVTVTSFGSFLYFSSGASASCLSSTISWAVNNPYSFSFNGTIAGQTLMYTLSSDSRMMTQTNLALLQCGDTATKTSASNRIVSQDQCTLLLAAMLLIGAMSARQN